MPSLSLAHHPSQSFAAFDALSDLTMPSESSLPLLDAFMATQSRLLKMTDLSTTTIEIVAGWLAHSLPVSLPVPTMLWTVKASYSLKCPPLRSGQDHLFLFFKSHLHAQTALHFIQHSRYLSATIPILPALEAELEPLAKLERFDPFTILPTTHSLGHLQQQQHEDSFSQDGMGTAHHHTTYNTYPMSFPASRDNYDGPIHNKAIHTYPYTISSNPPQPKSTFRLGDWICPLPNCGAHNFGKNTACIGCGSSRIPSMYPLAQSPPPSAFSSLLQPPSLGYNGSRQQHVNSSASPQRFTTSPRFLAPSVTNVAMGMNMSTQEHQSAFPERSTSTLTFTHAQQRHEPAPRVMPTRSSATPSHKVSPLGTEHPLLTPSGRAFAKGGEVRNVSDDPLVPCVMYWPDNEPLPERGQIRPTALNGCTQPPILNTGNRGPISHQPGDWICLKCNYLNWRRRKVCQTCFPYAEGNGDSISAAVQAERIALLTSVLRQTQQEQAQLRALKEAASGSFDLTGLGEALPLNVGNNLNPGVEATIGNGESSTIYQTRRLPQPTGVQAQASAQLLPSFLQEFVELDQSGYSPAVLTRPLSSPVSTVSSHEELYYSSATTSPPSSAVSLASSSTNSPVTKHSQRVVYRGAEDGLSPGYPSLPASPAGGSIWRLGGEESRFLGVVSPSALKFATDKKAAGAS